MDMNFIFQTIPFFWNGAGGLRVISFKIEKRKEHRG